MICSATFYETNSGRELFSCRGTRYARCIRDDFESQWHPWQDSDAQRHHDAHDDTIVH